MASDAGSPRDCTLMTAPFWPVEDVWPPGTLTQGCAMAYKLLNMRGVIALTKVIFNRRTLVTRVCYLTMEPIDSERKALLVQAKKDALMLDEAKWVQGRLDEWEGEMDGR